MKADLTDEILGRVMDQMDENYVAKDPFFTHQEPVYGTEKESEESGEDPVFDLEQEPDEIPDEEIELDDNDMLNEGDEEDDDFKF